MTVKSYLLRLGGEFHNATGRVTEQGVEIIALGPVALPPAGARAVDTQTAMDLAGLHPSVALADVRAAWARAHAREAQREALVLTLRGMAPVWDAQGLGEETVWLRQAARDLDVQAPTAENVCHAASLLAFVHDRRPDLCFLDARGQDVRLAMGALVMAYFTA